MKKILSFTIILFLSFSAMAQPFTKADTLRGSNGSGRSWWDVTKYDLNLKFHFDDESISGSNTISFKRTELNHANYFQIDLQEPLIIDQVLLEIGQKSSSKKKSKTEKLQFKKDGNAYFVYLEKNSLKKLGKNDIGKLHVYYHGKPRKAAYPPWDGGFVWKKDSYGNTWIAVACQGIGASVWYPCKDYQGDEPDSARIRLTVPDSMAAISNGQLMDVKDNDDGTFTHDWKVVNPINNYDISFYIGIYERFGDTYQGEKGPLKMDYWALENNVSKAKLLFRDAAPRMMKAFEYWFGPYPFYEDGYKLVEAPYLGMEHQSGIAYGNQFKKGYLGTDLSGTGEGLKWDFIIVHESGHEWFGNNITAKDVADMWIHESFTNYSETLYTEYYFGKESGNKYLIGTRKKILNDKPIIGIYGVNKEGSSDMYYKGGNMIHTIRQIINDDEKFRGILRGLNETFYHQTVTTAQIENYISTQAGIDFSKVFDQYLRDIRIPILEYKKVGEYIFYRWNNVVKGFDMKVKIKDNNGNYIFISPTEEFQQVPENVSEIKVDENFYVKTLNLDEVKN